MSFTNRVRYQPLAKLCYYTAAGAAGLAILSLAASWLGTGWNIESGMILISLFYAGLGTYYALTEKAPSTSAAKVAAPNIPTPHVAMNTLAEDVCEETADAEELELVNS